MTNNDALRAEIGLPGSYQDSMNKAMIDLDITPDATYIKGDVLIKQAALSVLKIMLVYNSVNEGGYAVSLAIEKRIAAIEGDLGMDNNAIPVLTDVSWKW